MNIDDVADRGKTRQDAETIDFEYSSLWAFTLKVGERFGGEKAGRLRLKVNWKLVERMIAVLVWRTRLWLDIGTVAVLVRRVGLRFNVRARLCLEIPGVVSKGFV